MKKFHEDVCPILNEAREKEELQDMTLAIEQARNLHLALETGLDDNAAALQQPSPPSALDDDSRPLAMSLTDIVTQPDGQGQPDNHLATLDERALLTASVNTEALELSYGEQIPPRDIEKGVTSPGEIAEVPSASEDNNGASRV